LNVKEKIKIGSEQFRFVGCHLFKEKEGKKAEPILAKEKRGNKEIEDSDHPAYHSTPQ